MLWYFMYHVVRSKYFTLVYFFTNTMYVGIYPNWDKTSLSFRRSRFSTVWDDQYVCSFRSLSLFPSMTVLNFYGKSSILENEGNDETSEEKKNRKGFVRNLSTRWKLEAPSSCSRWPQNEEAVFYCAAIGAKMGMKGRSSNTVRTAQGAQHRTGLDRYLADPPPEEHDRRWWKYRQMTVFYFHHNIINVTLQMLCNF